MNCYDLSVQCKTIEISLLKEMLEQNEIAKPDWIDKRFQLKDDLIKNSASTESLLNTFKNKSLEPYI